jgi:elongation factor Ts
MGISAEEVRQLRERTGAGMMECKNALVASSGNLDAAAELMRKQGQAKADKKATRVAAQGVIAIARAHDGRSAAMLEINCETDFVAREQEFVKFAAEVAHEALASKQSDVAALSARTLANGESIDVRRRALIAKIGENISIRRGTVLESSGRLGSYVHGTRIGVLIALEGGDEALARDLAMHVAAANPRYISANDVPAAELAKEREILTEQATREGKSPEIAAKMVEGRLRKSLAEITLLGQPFVKDPDQSVEKLLKAAGAKVLRFERFEVGAGIEKKQEDFAAEVMAQVSAAKKLS